ncbi:sugar phosphate isomerase/epimerase family protein [Paenibacillus thalictri]|uniref:Sugar phosphate isomerase/epimerase n=1 Tax=Paenibacillus thalictri TaxID=2527873 RepID=A0A4Q9DF67_9BACL|nr:sugar phosphate isomerase/epimerase [Paenibacillus thalictri]TBL70529.1 sugar phosphate isomerase/epimerase [Paenibacillus thalictri]
MKLKGMGVSLPINETTSNLERLKDKLHKIAGLGFDTVELPIQGMNVIKNGRINASRLQAYRDLLSSFPLQYTTHAPFDLNLFRQGDTSVDEKCLMASVDISGAIGAKIMVYHVGRYVGEEQLSISHSWARYTEEEKQALLQYEQKWMRTAGDRAQACGVMIAMENMRPYLDCADYVYALSPSALADQIEAVAHPHVQAVLDTGHLHMAVHMYGLDLLQELRRLAPYVIHMHLHDNYGRPCYSTEKSQYELAPLGRGDMHAPLGEGNLPFQLIAAELGPGFHGYVIHEVREMYESFWPQLRERYDQALGKTAAVSHSTASGV